MRYSESANFYHSQLRPHGISMDVASRMASIPLHQCVPTNAQAFAYADGGLPLAQNRTGLRSFEMGLLLQALAPTCNESVLEVGASSGYLTAVLSKWGCQVLCVEPCVAESSRIEKAVLAPLGIKNAKITAGDAHKGWGDNMFDIIVVNGALSYLPDALLKQLAIGGRLFVVIGSGCLMEATLIQHPYAGQHIEKVLFETQISPYPQPVDTDFLF